MSFKDLPAPNTLDGVRELLGGGTLKRALASAAASMSESRQPPCPHCLSGDVTHWGAAHGFPRYRCGSCRRTFNILTKTPLARLRNKERWPRSEEHTSELQSRLHLVCRLLLEKKKQK